MSADKVRYKLLFSMTGVDLPWYATISALIKFQSMTNDFSSSYDFGCPVSP